MDKTYRLSIFQDNWKVKRNFQSQLWSSLGSLHPAAQQADREEADFSLAGYNAGTISKEYVNAPPGITFPGDAGFNGDSPTVSHYYDFSPRSIGIVWDPRGKGTETIRAGYGLFYDTSTLWNTMHIVLNPPWGETIGIVPALVSAGGGLANPWGGYAGGDPFPVGLNPASTVTFPQAGTWIFENQNSHPSNSQQWNSGAAKAVWRQLVDLCHIPGQQDEPCVARTEPRSVNGHLCGHDSPGDR